MTTALFIELVAKVGLPAAEYAFSRFIADKDKPATQELLQNLKELSQDTSADALREAGIELRNGQVIRL